MKTQWIIRISAIALVTSFISLNLSSCKKTSGAASSGTFYFRLHTYIDSSQVTDTTALYKDSTGRHFGLTVAQFFIYNVVLQNTNGSTYTINDAYILKDIDSQLYVVGGAPPGTYNSVSFNVGLDPATNTLTPTIFAPVGSYISTSTMWYDAGNDGYMFMQVKGFADTTAAQNGDSANFVHLSYIIASAANLKTVTMPVRGTGSYAAYPTWTLSKDGTQIIDIICDYGKLLSTVNFKTQDSTDTYYFDPALGDSAANNIPNMFRYGQ